MEKQKVRVAVVGVGKMGLLHASLLNALPDVELAAICDRGKLIRNFCRKLLPSSVKITDDISKLSSDNIDAMYVTTPIPTHYSVISAICSFREIPNLFVEKTLTSSYDQSQELCKLVEPLGKTNMVGYMKRFSVTFNKARDLQQQEVIGHINSFEAYAYSSDFFGIEQSPEASSRGGVLSDLGSHAVDTALWFFGDFQVKPETIMLADKNNGVLHFGVLGPNSLEGKFDMSWAVDGFHVPEIGLLLKGTEGTIKVNEDVVELQMKSGKTFSWYKHDLTDNVGFLLGGSEYFREDKYFVDSMLRKSKVQSDFHSASKVDYIIQQVLE